MNGAGFRMIILLYRKSSIKPPEGSLFISDTFEGGGGAWWRRGLICEGVVIQFSKDGGISSPAIKNYNTNPKFQLVNTSSQISQCVLLQSWLTITVCHLSVKDNKGEEDLRKMGA